MSGEPMANLRTTLQRILSAPTASDLWQLQGDLLIAGGPAADGARQVAGRFYSYLQDLESKVASRQASRRAALLATGAVTSVGLQEWALEQGDSLQRILGSGLAALLEIGSATQNVQAWEVETSLVHYNVAWYLYGELWAISLTNRPDLAADERRAYVERLLAPAVAAETPAAARPALLIRLFQVVLAARLLPLWE